MPNSLPSDLSPGEGVSALPIHMRPPAPRSLGRPSLNASAHPPADTKPRLLDRVRLARPDRRTRHDSRKTEDAYCRHETILQRAVKEAVRKAGVVKHVGCRTFRRFFATHLLADGYDIRTVQELLGHQGVKTTMMYTHVLTKRMDG